MNMIEPAKAALRGTMRERLRQITAAEQQAASKQLCVLASSQSVWQTARVILLFAPVAGEPDIWSLLTEALTQGKQVGLPAFDPGTNTYVARRIKDPSTDVVVGSYGIRESADHGEGISWKQLDLILVPGLAFDARGGRLGRGKGFYDRLLANVSGTKCGVAFDEQLVEAVPVGPQDIPLNCIMTPTRWIET